jgi:hypothetical protein
LLKRRRVARRDHDPRAFPSQLPGNGTANAPTSAGDERALALKLEIHAT